MKHECNYNTDLGFVEAVTHGAATREDMVSMCISIRDLCEKHPSANVVVDHSDLDAGPLSMDDIRYIADLVVSSRSVFAGRKCAHIAVKDIQFGLVRAWEILVELSGMSDLDTMSFRSRDSAIEWIKSNS